MAPKMKTCSRGHRFSGNGPCPHCWPGGARKHALRFVPPSSVTAAAKKGLALRKKFGRGATAVGLARGRQLAARKSVSLDVVKRMFSYFSRHFIDKQGRNYGNEANPSKGYIAWLLWGGDPGARWAEGIRRDLKARGEW